MPRKGGKIQDIIQVKRPIKPEAKDPGIFWQQQRLKKELIEKWAPILIFHPEEPCFSSNAEDAYDTIRASSLFLIFDNTPALDVKAPCYYQNIEYGQDNFNIIRIKYWFWYNLNWFPIDPLPTDVPTHIGDWESIEVTLINKELHAILFSNHETYLTAWPNEVEFRNGRLIVRVAKGSHANYPSLNVPLYHYDIQSEILGRDIVWKSFYDHLANSNLEWDTKNRLIDINATNFKDFKGYWGSQFEFLFWQKSPLSPIVRQNENNIPFYKITTYTGTRDDAGTNANVYIKLQNENSYIWEFQLDNYLDNFEQGDTDIFPSNSNPRIWIFPFFQPLPPNYIDPMHQTGHEFPSWNNNYLADITKIRLGQDNSGYKPGWYVKKVEIQDMITKKIYLFECNKWLAADEGGTSFEFNRSN
jgi:hypothetical protein